MAEVAVSKNLSSAYFWVSTGCDAAPHKIPPQGELLWITASCGLFLGMNYYFYRDFE
jgi:hypothetical protein